MFVFIYDEVVLPCSVVLNPILWIWFIYCQVVLAMHMQIMCGIRVISIMILHVRFLYVEEFLILPCPACPTCRCYISVELSDDTFIDTLSCQVSEISACIRYDGWCAISAWWWNEHIRCSVFDVLDVLGLMMMQGGSNDGCWIRDVHVRGCRFVSIRIVFPRCLDVWYLLYLPWFHRHVFSI